MKDLFVSYLYKLRHDITFKIVLIIGGSLAVLMSLIYFGLSFVVKAQMVDGPTIFISSLSPVQNFGLAVPINLITFTILEFSQGGIRNKIIAGHSKEKIYLSLFFSGLFFTLVLMILYSGLSFGFGSLFGVIFSSVSSNYAPLNNTYGDLYFLKIIILALLTYSSIVAFTIFFATLFRNVGPTISVVIAGLLIGFLSATIISLAGSQNEILLTIGRIFDPLYGISVSEGNQVVGSNFITIKDETFYANIGSNLVYMAIWLFGGLLIFRKRDIK